MLGSTPLPLQIAQITPLKCWFTTRVNESVIRDEVNNVSQWNDLSGNKSNAVQAVGASQPLYDVNGINGQPFITMTGNQFLSLPAGLDYTTTGELEIFCVLQAQDTTEIKVIIGQWAGTKSWMLRYIQNEQVQILTGNPTNGIVGVNTSTGSLFAPIIINSYFTPSQIGVTYNGIVFDTIATTSAINTPNTASIRIGERSDGAENFQGVFFELMVFGGALSIPHRQAVYNYLVQQWGIA